MLWPLVAISSPLTDGNYGPALTWRQLSPLSRSVIPICGICASCFTTWLTPLLTMQFASSFGFATNYILKNLALANCCNDYACRICFLLSYEILKEIHTSRKVLPKKWIRQNSGLDMVQSCFLFQQGGVWPLSFYQSLHDHVLLDCSRWHVDKLEPIHTSQSSTFLFPLNTHLSGVSSQP